MFIMPPHLCMNQEPRSNVDGYLWLKISHEVFFNQVASSEGLTRVGGSWRSSFKLTEMNVNKSQSLTMWNSPWSCLRSRQLTFPSMRNTRESETK